MYTKDNACSKPPDIPSNPNREYKGKGWTDWGDWLRTENIAAKNKNIVHLKKQESLYINWDFVAPKNGNDIVSQEKTNCYALTTHSQAMICTICGI
jgi:hypothetical protein